MIPLEWTPVGVLAAEVGILCRTLLWSTPPPSLAVGMAEALITVAAIHAASAFVRFAAKRFGWTK